MVFIVVVVVVVDIVALQPFVSLHRLLCCGMDKKT